MSLFSDAPKPFYRLLIGELWGEVASWAVWSTHDTQREAYEAMADYRESYPSEMRLTPLRIVRVAREGKPEDEEDRTFVDETGVGLEEWKRMIEAEEIEREC
jgi:hypothetical protein